MTLSVPTLLTSSSSTADSATYNTASITPTTGSLVLAVVSAGKAANLSESATSVTQGAAGGMGALTKVASIGVPNNNQTLSVWKGIGTGVAGALTIAHAGVMDNCIWHIIRFTSDVATPTVRQFKTSNETGTGLITVSLDSTALASSVVMGLLGLNAGATVVPAVATGYTQLGTTITSTSPTTQQMIEYDTSSPFPAPGFNIAGTNGRATIGIEVADGVVVTPPTGPQMTWYNGTTEVPLASTWYNGTTEVSLTHELT